jgi:hypothetical protein
VEIGHNAHGEPLSKLRLESSRGIHTTLIRHNFAATPGIAIAVNGVRIGRRNRGFTVSTPNGSIGIATTGGVVTGSVIEGNRVSRGDYGIWVHGGDTAIRHNVAEHVQNTGILCGACFSSQIKDNVSRDNGWGFVLENHDNMVFSRNVAAYNSHNGFYIFGGNPIEFKDNVAEFNGEAGFLAGGMSEVAFYRNIAFANESHGFDMNDGLGMGNPKALNNAAIGNVAAGFNMDGVSNINVKGNTLNGNLIGMNIDGDSSMKAFNHNNTLASTGGCGIQNQSGAPLIYASHYFGSASGPDDVFDADNHDAVCGPDVVNGSHAAKPGTFKANIAGKL